MNNNLKTIHENESVEQIKPDLRKPAKISKKAKIFNTNQFFNRNRFSTYLEKD